MAEFQEVMREWVRSRKTINENKLSYCPLEMFTNDYIANIEKEVMTWAAEHPEPVYPTWGEWLQEQGVLDVEYIPSASRTTSTSKSYIQTVKTLAPFYRPIPADIAQKLGITPKENY